MPRTIRFSSYRVDATTGALTLIGTPTATGISPHAIVGYDYYDGPALKRQLFVANEGSNDVSAYTVDVTTGAVDRGSRLALSRGYKPPSHGHVWPQSLRCECRL